MVKESNSTPFGIRLAVVMVILAVVPLCELKAQHHIGVRAGYGMGTIARIQPAEQTGMLWGLKSAGISYKYYGQIDRFANGVQIDLQFIQKGFKRKEIYYSGAPQDTTVTYSRWINSIELPIFWHPYYTFFDGRLGVFLNLGVSVSYNINSTYQWKGTMLDDDGDIVDVVYDSGDYEFLLTRDNRWNYGLVGGAGVSYIKGRSEFYFEGRYYIGYSDILKNRTIYEGNPRQSPLDGMNFSIGYFYRLGGRNKEKIAIPEELAIPLTPADGQITPQQAAHEKLHEADSGKEKAAGQEDSVVGNDIIENEAGLGRVIDSEDEPVYEQNE